MKWHLEVLRSTQDRALFDLGPTMERMGFYLAGGTAVALHLGHRRSVDLDWFSGESLGDIMKLARALTEGVGFKAGRVAPGTLHGARSGVRLSFLEYFYPNLRKPSFLAEFGCRIASLDDLACMKLSAVAQRGSKKDFVDVYAILLEHRSLPDILKLYQKKYHISDISHLLTGLAYFDDAEEEPMPVMLWRVKWEDVKEAIRKSLREFARSP